MKTKTQKLYIAVLSTLAVSPLFAAVPGLYSTGVDSANAPLPPGVADVHWSVTSYTLDSGGSAPATVIGQTTTVGPNPPASWAQPAAGSRWITPPNSANGLQFAGASGTVIYATTLGNTCASGGTLRMVGTVRADNNILAIRIGDKDVQTFPNSNNNNDLSLTGTHNAANPYAFDLTATFPAGQNRVSFVVKEWSTFQTGNWNGLNVAFNQSLSAVSACTVAPAPTPAPTPAPGPSQGVGDAGRLSSVGIPAVGPLGLGLISGLIGLLGAAWARRRK